MLVFVSNWLFFFTNAIREIIHFFYADLRFEKVPIWMIFLLQKEPVDEINFSVSS